MRSLFLNGYALLQMQRKYVNSEAIVINMCQLIWIPNKIWDYIWPSDTIYL